MSKQIKLSFGCVTFSPDLKELIELLDSLYAEFKKVNEYHQKLSGIFFLIDNGPTYDSLSDLLKVKEYADANFNTMTIEIITGHGNIGFGSGQNLCLSKVRSDYHFILNSDLTFNEGALINAISFLEDERYSDTVLLAPKLLNLDGSTQYGIKLYPSVFVLILRFIGNRFFSTLYAKHVFLYEEREKVALDRLSNAEIISGCCMLFRTPALKKLEGFDERFFLYFEDFDLSIRANELGKVVYNPSVVITHYGGGAGRKGWLHIRMFMRSAIQFFNKHGWKWV